MGVGWGGGGSSCQSTVLADQKINAIVAILFSFCVFVCLLLWIQRLRQALHLIHQTIHSAVCFCPM